MIWPNKFLKAVCITCCISIFLLYGCHKNYDWFHSKSKWIKDFFAEINTGNYPGIYAVSWWNEDFDFTYLTVNSSNKSLKAYQESVSNDNYISDCSFLNNKLIPVSSKFYLGANPGFSGPEDDVTSEIITGFEDMTGKKIAWAYFSNNWDEGIVFPSENVNIIKSTGKIPFIRMMARSEFEENLADPVYHLLDFVNGAYDAQLTAWATAAKNCNSPLLVEFGTEVNGDWFPWNGKYCGGGTTDGYGDPSYPDGPEIFRDAYRHIIDICDQQGATNITWFYHFDDESSPEESWNDPALYYPGDDYIDWIGISTYGPFDRGENYIKPSELLNSAYDQMKSVSENKPYAILEFGVTEL
jgi:hypothetical protein